MKYQVVGKDGNVVTSVEYDPESVPAVIVIEAVYANDDPKGSKKFSGVFSFQPESNWFFEAPTKNFLCIGDGELFALP